MCFCVMSHPNISYAVACTIYLVKVVYCDGPEDKILLMWVTLFQLIGLRLDNFSHICNSDEWLNIDVLQSFQSLHRWGLCFQSLHGWGLCLQFLHGWGLRRRCEDSRITSWGWRFRHRDGSIDLVAWISKTGSYCCRRLSCDLWNVETRICRIEAGVE